MKSRISPLKSGDHGADVANLQDALLLLIDNRVASRLSVGAGGLSTTAAEKNVKGNVVLAISITGVHVDNNICIVAVSRHKKQPGLEADNSVVIQGVGTTHREKLRYR